MTHALRVRRRPLLLVPLLALVVACSGGDGGGDGGSGGDAAPAPAPSAPAPTAAEPVPVLAWAPCEEGFECASLPVPLGDTGRTLDLAVTRRPATGPGERLGSLVVNPGGPGASAVDYLQAAYVGLPFALQARFDLVAFDPRGVGRSAAVRCGDTAGLDAYYALDVTPDAPAELDALVAGSDALAAGCAARAGDLLPHLSTAEAAADLDRVRAAVGDARLTYLGYSYGTSIGAAYLQAHPDRVRAMVLDGAIDPALSWDGLLAGQAAGFDGALRAFLDDCAAVRCAFVDATGETTAAGLGAAFDRLVARVDGAPLDVGRRALGPGELVFAAAGGLYDRVVGWRTLGQGLADAQQGDGRTLLSMADSYSSRTDEGYDPLLEGLVAVTCLDRPWPRDVGAYTALAARLEGTAPRFGEALALGGLPCRAWPVPPVAEPAPVTAEGAPPVVVIGTTRDPATPYDWAVALADQLASGVLLTHDGDGHTVYRSGAPDCVVEPVTDYLVGLQPPAEATCRAQ